MNSHVYYHTRHIPEEHLLLDTQMGQGVKNNMLCESIDNPCAEKLVNYGIDIVETRIVWNELEPEKGKYDFSRLDRDIKKIKEKGMGVGVFPWFQYPPKWYNEGTLLKCPEHGEESTLISIWDTDRLLGIYDRLYGVLAEHCGDQIDFIYVGVYSDYGEVCMPLGVSHYKFSPKHICRRSNWDADDLAVKSREAALNNNNSIYAYSNWYTNTVMDFTDKVCAIFRKHFPNTRAALPLGCVGERLCNGQIKSLSAKIAAKYNITARWTGWCLGGTFDKSHIGTRRLSTASKFYGADFGLETPLYLAEETAPHALFEVLSNNTTMIHNDPGNIFRAYDVYVSMRDYNKAVPFTCDKALFYPLEAEQIGIIDYDDQLPIYAEMRKHFDYEVTDTLMLNDGYRNNLVFSPNAPITKESADLISKLGVEVIYLEEAPPYIIETGKKFRCGTPIKDYSDLGQWNGCYHTKRENDTVTFDTNTNKITINSYL